jgi:hypothetical protein
MFVHVVDTIASSASSVLAVQAPVPGTDKPPFEKGIIKLLGWVLWIATAACVGGVLVTGAKMAMAWRGGGDSNVAQLGWVLLGCVLLGTATSIVNALL